MIIFTITRKENCKCTLNSSMVHWLSIFWLLSLYPTLEPTSLIWVSVDVVEKDSVIKLYSLKAEKTYPEQVLTSLNFDHK